MADTTANRAYPYPETTDDVRPYADIQALAEALDIDIDALVNKPVGRLRQTVTQSGLTDATIFAVTFTTEDFDTHSYHSTSSNTSRVTPTKAGYYRTAGVLCFAGQSDYVGLDAMIRLNGTALQGATRYGPPGNNTTIALPVDAIVPINGSGDYFELAGRADRSGNTSTGTTFSSFLGSTLEWEYIRPL